MKEKKIKEFIELFINLDEHEKEEVRDMVKAVDMKLALWDISQEIFRPARKYGYNNKVQEIFEKCGEYGPDLVSELESMFYEILEERGIDLY